MNAFERWWHDEGSGMPPLPGEDAEEYARRVCEIAWDNGAFSASGTELEVCRDIARRQQEGIRKYGMTVADNPAPLLDWLQHAYEEALDLSIYLKRSMGEMSAPLPTCSRCGRETSNPRRCACCAQDDEMALKEERDELKRRLASAERREKDQIEPPA